MKSVLISIQPKWCELIASGKKTVEVRKTKPKLETPFKVYIYCTIDGGVKGDMLVRSKLICGKVIGEFICDRISGGTGEYAVYHTEGTCLTPTEIADYIGDKYAYYWHISDLVIYDKPRELGEFYAVGDCDCLNCKKCPWFDCGNGYNVEDDCNLAFKGLSLGKSLKPILRPPQSWCYVESEDTE